MKTDLVVIVLIGLCAVFEAAGLRSNPQQTAAPPPGSVLTGQAATGISPGIVKRPSRHGRKGLPDSRSSKSRPASTVRGSKPKPALPPDVVTLSRGDDMSSERPREGTPSTN